MNGPLILHGGDTGTTAAAGDNTAKLSTTAFVHTALAGNITPTSVAANTGAANTAGSFTTNGSSSTISVNDTGAVGANIALNGSGAVTPSKFIRANLGNLEFINSAYSAVIATLSDSGTLTANNVTANNSLFVAGTLTANAQLNAGNINTSTLAANAKSAQIPH
jgi:hypothetical protein